jgi:hypothetical protein
MGVWKGFELRALHLSHASSPFCSGYFGDGGLENCLPRLALNLLILASQVPRITGESHWYQT